MALEIAVLIVALLALAGIILMLIKPQAKTGTTDFQETLDKLHKNLIELVTRSSGETKQAVSSAFSKEFVDIWEKINKQLEAVRETVEKKLGDIQKHNDTKLEEMRKTVDEKLHMTLERRLGESFQLVGERLEQVHKGLGEMQTLAASVGDIKKVLTNVKTRGIWGEVLLGNLLEQILTSEQYQQNVVTKKGGNEPVEYAIRLPGKDQDDGQTVWLPIDSKYPKEDYERLLDAQERADKTGADEAGRDLETTLKNEAKDIRDKYLDPPHTTDFAIMFLPSEGLYAEAVRRPGLSERLQREYRVSLAGPTTLTAILNSLLMGFRTLAIQKRSSEVWALLGTIKTEFGKFGDLLDKTHKKLQEATNTIEDASKKSRTIERKLKGVGELPIHKAASLLELDEEQDVESLKEA
ncbi:MAG: DNA recombination protein RmuC [Elusimicrobia bacterium]|nr:DNA recombination protein RmuC [Elusimicrobiota bacterium]